MLLLASFEWKQRKDENPEGGECGGNEVGRLHDERMATQKSFQWWEGTQTRGLDEEVMVQKRCRRRSDHFVEGSRHVRETCYWTGCRHAQVGQQMEPRLVTGTEPGIRRAQRWHFGRSPQVSIHLEAPREATLGQEDVD